MRRLSRSDSGASAVIVAILVFALFGFGALVIDVGGLYQERRELQSGADAGALAVAKDCAAKDCGLFAKTAEDFADRNADDGDSDVPEVCGNSEDGTLPVCNPAVADVPDGAIGYVRATATTREVASASNKITFTLARVFGLTGSTVGARAVAAWGVLKKGTSTSLTISKCEYEEFTKAEGSVQSPPFTGDPITIYFHNPNGTDKANSANTPCQAGPAGSDLPGGFGWLDSGGDCQADTNADGWASADPGNDVKKTGCDPTAWIGKTILVPVYDAISSASGTKAEYHIDSYAAFHVVGVKFPSMVAGNTSTCTGGSNCIVGYFTTYAGAGGEWGDPSDDMGARSVKMIG